MWLVDYEDFRRGHLLRDGGLDDQPARWMQAMCAIDAALAEFDRSELDKKRVKNLRR